jgi:small subunit ribosomal protein S16
MLIIRLQRVGRRNDPSFRVVVTDSKRAPKSGKYLELLGFHNPRTDETVLKGERIKHWISKGAQVSGTLHNLLISHSVIEGKKVNVLPRGRPVVKEDVPVEATSQEAAESEEAPLEEAAAEEPQSDLKNKDVGEEGKKSPDST